MCGQYASVYSSRVKHLILLSPAGVPELKEGETGMESIEDRLKGTWKGRLAVKFLKYFWKKNVTPFEIARKFGALSSGLFKRYVNGRFKDDSMSKEERLWLGKYLYQVNMQKGSGEYGLCTCFKPGLWAHNSLRKRFH